MKLALPAQAELARELVHDALEQGARRLGSEESESQPNEFQPAVLADVQPDMAICRQASFAPLLAVIPFDHLEDALAADRQCPYALGASIFTSNMGHAARLASQFRAGVVTINDVIAPTGHPATPFGGQGASGWGVTQGAEGLLEMTVPQVVSVRSGKWRPHYDPPGASRLTSLAAFQAMLRWGHAESWRSRLAGLIQFIRTLRKPSADSKP